MLQDLLNTQRWNDFLLQKIENEFADREEQEALTRFIESGEYLTISEQIVAGTCTFSIPRKKQIAKNASGKKRTVYFYSPTEMLVLKYIAFLLYRYDSLFSPNLYSFRRGKGVKSAITNLTHIARVKRMYGVKVDISNYFNSIRPETLLPELSKDVDEDLHSLLSLLLMRKEVMVGRQVMSEETGAMAGTPFAPFLANYYLKDMDAWFWQQPVVYMRYADDILLFANTEEELESSYAYMLDFLHQKGLSVNPSKVCRIQPGDDFEFLGFLFGQQKIDVAHHAVEKMKGKIRRKARALRRWYLRKELTPEKALKAMNKRFNSKFYGRDKREMSWMYWYFPYITTSESLASIDHYMQQMQRWVFTGRHYKGNYKACSYDQLKQYGYRPLVPEYYVFREASSDSEAPALE